MKILFATAAFAAMFSTASYAATMNFPSDAPVAAITIPDSWKPTETESGIEATSEDQAIYFSIDVADAKTSDKVIEDAVAFLEKNGVKIDGSTQQQAEDKVNGMDVTTFGWNGTDADGDVTVALAVLSPKPGKLLVITYWGSKGTQEQHGPELDAMMTSLRPAAE